MIDPVTRIEGHAKISLHLDDQGRVQEAYFHVTQFRGFEKFCEGRPFYEMPSLMARICGICPVSHLIASAKACDEILAVRIPQTALKLRRILNLAQIVQSHALSFFYLASPDLLLGMDADPAERNIFGVMRKHPELARDGIRLRQFGQQIIEWLAGKRIHPAWVVPGGVSEPLTAERRATRFWPPFPRRLPSRSARWTGSRARSRASARRSAPSPTSPACSWPGGRDGGLEHYDGGLRFMDSTGRMVADQVPAADYGKYIGELVNPWSYLKTPYYKPLGYPDGIYRVGPLARLNVVDCCQTRLAAGVGGVPGTGARAVLSSFYYHYARLIEILYGIERIEQLLNDPEILSTNVRALRGGTTARASGWRKPRAAR